jgi:hypothetical protein
MHIHQLAVHYDAPADRLLLRVRSSDDAVFAVWLTRRLCLRLWPHLSSLVLAEGVRERTLQQADFSQPFAARGRGAGAGADAGGGHARGCDERSPPRCAS